MVNDLLFCPSQSPLLLPVFTPNNSSILLIFVLFQSQLIFMKDKVTVSDIDSYIAGFPENIQPLLEQVRATIKEVAPEAKEGISYGMPTFYLHGSYLVYFAGFKNHIGFYPTPVGMDAFKADLAGYKTGKGSVQFPINQPLPFDLIRKITAFRVSENQEKAKASK